jgi:PTS system nitrogen regulatory IIA component
MDLKVEDVARLLNVNEKTVSRWVKEGKLPAYTINSETKFSNLEIEEWVLSRQKEVLKESESKVDVQGRLQFLLYRAIFKGGVYVDIEGATKKELIQNAMQTIANNFEWDAQVVTDLLLDREQLMSTAIGNGVAIPHTRDFFNKDPYDIVVTLFLSTPIEYGALDKKPVHTLFFLFACDDKRHLNLLSKISHLTRDEQALKFLQSKPDQKSFLEYIKNWESHF